MKLFTAEQIYAADKFTIEKQGTSSDALMERAAVQLFNWLHMRMQGAPVKIHLFCGIGNNGGDGIALARHLQEHGYNIGVYVVNYSKTRSKDFLINLDRLKARKLWPTFLEDAKNLPAIGPDDIIVDAIFGIGLNRPPAKWVVDLMGHLHRSRAFILSIDIPSGLFTHKMPEDPNAVIQSNFVLTIQAPKLVFFLPQTGPYVQQWAVLDIGLDSEYLYKTETEFELVGKPQVQPLYRSRSKYSHKGTYGHSLIIGGSYGKIGAVSLSAKASLRTGTGLVTVYVPQCGYIPLQTSLPEAMVLTDQEEGKISKIAYDLDPSAIGIGMGMGTTKETSKAFSDFLDSVEVPLVIDADGLNMLSLKKDMLKKLPPMTIITPHPKELERLIGKWKDDFDKLDKARQFSKKYNCILVLKGAHTITLHGDKGYVNTTGNPGMATAGSGDVLTGMITALLAQGYAPLHAAIFGVYLHGRAGDIAVEKLGYEALMANDLIYSVGTAFIDLFKVPSEPQESDGGEERSA
ncbi:MAG: NAD(P)H-hydrate dehydratase [Flavobacteriaceae bacterium]